MRTARLFYSVSLVTAEWLKRNSWCYTCAPQDPTRRPACLTLRLRSQTPRGTGVGGRPSYWTLWRIRDAWYLRLPGANRALSILVSSSALKASSLPSRWSKERCYSPSHRSMFYFSGVYIALQGLYSRQWSQPSYTATFFWVSDWQECAFEGSYARPSRDQNQTADELY